MEPGARERAQPQTYPRGVFVFIYLNQHQMQANGLIIRDPTSCISLRLDWAHFAGARLGAFRWRLDWAHFAVGNPLRPE